MFHYNKETQQYVENFSEARKDIFSGNYVLAHHDKERTVSTNDKTEKFLIKFNINGCGEKETAQKYLEEMFSHKRDEYLKILPKDKTALRQTPWPDVNEKISKVGTVGNQIIIVSARSALCDYRKIYVKYGYRRNDNKMVVVIHVDEAIDYERYKIMQNMQ